MTKTIFKNYELEALEAAQMSFEQGHYFEREDFKSNRTYKKYLEYMEYGPSGFYSEFKDTLDFDEFFVAEYSNEYDEE